MSDENIVKSLSNKYIIFVDYSYAFTQLQIVTELFLIYKNIDYRKKLFWGKKKILYFNYISEYMLKMHRFLNLAIQLTKEIEISYKI